MQTFMPNFLFRCAVACLDNKRLGKQRVEAKQILDVLSGKTEAWKNHPTVLMWKGYDNALRYYLRCCIEEWIRRGFRNNMSVPRIESSEVEYPDWVFDFYKNSKLISSHRAALLAKDPKWYGQFGWTEEPKIDYYWPVRK